MADHLLLIISLVETKSTTLAIPFIHFRFTAVSENDGCDVRRCWISWTFWMRWGFGYPCIGLRWVLRLDQGLILMVSTYRIHVLKHWFGSTSLLRNITSYLSLAIKKWQWWNWTTASYTYYRHQLHNIIMLLSSEVTINQGAVEFFCGLCPVCDTLGSIVCTQQC